MLGGLWIRSDARVQFIRSALEKMQAGLLENGSALEIHHGYPTAVFRQLLSVYEIAAVYANHDYEPYARERDKEITGLLAEEGIPFRTYKDQVIFEKDEVVKDDGKPYTVFT